MKDNIAPTTIARTIILLVALANQVLAIAGKGTIDIAENDVYQVVSLIATIVSALVAWWKNNSFTQKAIEADKAMHKNYGDGQSETENLINKEKG